MRHSLRRSRITVMVGFLTVAAGWVGYLALVVDTWSTSAGESRANLAFGLGSLLGYAILAGASWSWFRWMENSAVPLTGLRHTLHLFALGNLAIGIGLTGVAYFWMHQADSQFYDKFQIVAALAYGLQCLGFVLAAAAFRGAAAAVGTVDPELPTLDGELLSTQTC